MNTYPGSRNSRTKFLYMAAMLCAFALLAPLAGAAVNNTPGNTLPLYMVHHNDNNIDTLDPQTGVELTSVPITQGGEGVTGGFWGLDMHPTTKKLFAIWQRTELVTIDPVTGAMTDIGPTGHNVGGITFATVGSNVVLYMVSGNSDEANPDTLFTLNTATGAATLVLAFTGGNNIGETIAFNPIDGFLYRAYGSGLPNDQQFFVKVDPVSLTVTNITLSVDVYSQATSLTHWAGNFFLLADHGSDLYIINTNGQVRLLAPLNTGSGDTKGLVFTGAPAACSPLAALYGAANIGPDGPSLLYSISPTTGVPTLIGPIGFERVSGIAFNASQTLFGVGERQNGSNTNVLISINPCSAAGNEIGPTLIKSDPLLFTAIGDISVRKSDGKLFGFLASNAGDSNGLATLNTSTGAYTLVNSYPLDDGGGIAFSSTGVLYNVYGDSLETIDPTTGTMTFVTDLSFPNVFLGSTINAIDFQQGSGLLFGSVVTEILAPTTPAVRLPSGVPATVPANFLVTIDKSEGTVSSVGQMELGMDAIAFTPAAVQPAASITATGGTPQSTRVNSAFGLPLQATVKDSTSAPVAGVTVTFTAPGSGASATFAGGTNTAVTNASGVATSVLVSANGTVGGPFNVAAAVAGVATPANFALTNTPGPPAQIAVTSGTPQTATVTTAFALPLAATVKDNFGNVTPGVTVTFTAPSTGASGTFTGGNTAVTNASGVATSGTFTANATSGGPYNVTASLPATGSPEFAAATALPEGFATQVSFSLKNVDFAVAPTTTTQTVTAGGTANYSLNFTAIVGNSVNPTTFSCTGLPALSACVFTPATLPANSPNTPFTLAISTTAAGSHLTTVGPANKFVGPFMKIVKPGVFVILALLLSIFAIPKRGFVRKDNFVGKYNFARLRVSAIGVFGFASLLLLTSFISGCGGAGTGFPLGNNSPGTPAGTSTVTIVGTSGTVTRTTTVTLVVQ